MSDNPERLYPMLLNFVRKEYVSKNLLRVTVTGEDLIGFPENQGGTHIKVFFPNRENGILQLPYREGETVVYQNINRSLEHIQSENTVRM